ncbi:MAG: hypothetical protein ACLTKE_14785 [Coprococcus sp.]
MERHTCELCAKGDCRNLVIHQVKNLARFKGQRGSGCYLCAKRRRKTLVVCPRMP